MLQVRATGIEEEEEEEEEEEKEEEEEEDWNMCPVNVNSVIGWQI
jgi:hypothetical protein